MISLIQIKNHIIAWIKFSPGSKPRKVLKSSLLLLISIVLKNYKIKNAFLSMLNHFPKIKHRLKQIKNTNYVEIVPLNLNNISARQREIYISLKKMNERSKVV